jgi:hypothetical protein
MKKISLFSNLMGKYLMLHRASASVQMREQSLIIFLLPSAIFVLVFNWFLFICGFELPFISPEQVD